MIEEENEGGGGVDDDDEEQQQQQQQQQPADPAVGVAAIGLQPARQMVSLFPLLYMHYTCINIDNTAAAAAFRACPRRGSHWAATCAPDGESALCVNNYNAYACMGYNINNIATAAAAAAVRACRRRGRHWVATCMPDGESVFIIVHALYLH